MGVCCSDGRSPHPHLLRPFEALRTAGGHSLARGIPIPSSIPSHRRLISRAARFELVFGRDSRRLAAPYSAMKKVTLPLLVAPLLFCSCASEPTFGDRLIAQGESTRTIGEQWNKGNSLITEGEKQKKKGRQMIEEGEKLIKKGEKNIERGRLLKSESESAAS